MELDIHSIHTREWISTTYLVSFPYNKDNHLYVRLNYHTYVPSK